MSTQSDTYCYIDCYLSSPHRILFRQKTQYTESTNKGWKFMDDCTSENLSLDILIRGL